MEDTTSELAMRKLKCEKYNRLFTGEYFNRI